MKKNFTLTALFLIVVLLLSACSTSDSILSTTERESFSTKIPAIVPSPVDVQTAFIASHSLEPQAVTVAEGNLFDNGGFESGLAGWTACAAGAIAASSDALEGTGALQVNPGNCFYRSVSASAGQKIALSCNVKLLSGTSWTGMGFNFTDSSFATLSSAPNAIATSNNYSRLATVATAPANTQVISMWLYSDNLAVVDNCSLLLETDQPPIEGNLLQNPSFNSTGSWNNCGNNSSFNISGGNLNLSNGGCIYQTVVATPGTTYALSCQGSTDGSSFGSLSLSMLNSSYTLIRRKEVPYTDTNSQTLSGSLQAPTDTAYAAVTFYTEGTATYSECSLVASSSPPPLPGNLLENSEFTGANGSQPLSWTVGCANNASLQNNALSVSGGTCVDQTLDADEVSALLGSNYTLQCSAANGSGYAALSILFDGTPVSKVIPVNESGIVKVTGTAPTSFTTATVSIYAESALVVDNCSLLWDDSEPPSGDNLLLNSNFASQSDWVACSSPDNFTLGNGLLTTSGQACIYQTVDARADLDYTLSCSAKLDSPSWSSMILSMLDENWALITEVNTQIDSTSFATKELTLAAPSNVKYVGATFYTEGATSYESCTLISSDVAEPIDPNLVGQWTFDEGTGSTANDSSLYGNTATIENGAWGAGKIAGALEMDGGDNSIVRIPLSDSLRGTANTITVMAWGYRTANHNVALISHGYPDLFFGYHGPQYKWQIRNEQGTFAECYAGNAPLNEWQHVAATFDGATAKLYANGVEICSRPLAGSIPMRDLPFLVSGFINTNDQIIDEITGKIDDVRIYDRVLNIIEIQEIYNSASN